MTLIGAILRKVQSVDSVARYPSPPPDLDSTVLPKRRKYVNKYGHVLAAVDSSAPRYDARRLPRRLPEWSARLRHIYTENIRLLIAIKRTHFARGRVDCRWSAPLRYSRQYYENRVRSLKLLQQRNEALYQLITAATPRVTPTRTLRADWRRNRRAILSMARAKFVLFPPVPGEMMEDDAFAPPPGVKRPRVYMTLRIRGGATLGELLIELFTEVCPRTCALFAELLAGDGVGYGYVGTRMFRKVPRLYWSGGDVVYDSGFGCYAQRGRTAPIGAENYHFSHSMPGLLSMRVTRDDEMCGIFNITFKSLPQFDLRNVVFGRVVRPCRTFDSIASLGSALSSQPVVEVSAARLRGGGAAGARAGRAGWVCGAPNTRGLSADPPRTPH